MYKNIDEALKTLLPFVIDNGNSLWDSGLLFISKDGDENYLVELIGFYYESEEERKSLRPFEIERQIQFDPRHRQVYDYLQQHFTAINPKVKWDRLILEVHDDGKFTPHYEFEGDEVSPDAPPAPETLTTAYLCENLRNCLSHNAPDNYQWVWEVLSRNKTEDGKIQIGGEFYYSLNEDQSDPQLLEPGEYIYMYNVSEQLFDDFLNEKTKGWSKIRLGFSRQGKVLYQVLNREF